VQLPVELHDEHYCVLSTVGRVTGRRHSAELWFVPTDGGVHLMSGSGGLTTWCLNLEAEEQGVIRIGSRSWLARAAVVAPDDPERAAALGRFHAKYDPPGKDRTEPWMRNATLLQLVFTRELDPR
jgi:deazaflavin-dependent oxidoreductase (nitroreductase family)